jgi:hypothetical protein
MSTKRTHCPASIRESTQSKSAILDTRQPSPTAGAELQRQFAEKMLFSISAAEL